MRVLVLVILSFITCSNAPADGPFKGIVTDSPETPIAVAMVLIHWDSAGSTVGLADNLGIKEDLVIRTKQDGTFSADLPPGFYDVFVSAPAFSPTSRKVQVKAGEAQLITFRMIPDPLYTTEMGNRVQAVAGFSHVSDGYIPEGKPIEQPGSSTLLQCEVTCARNPNCKAYAFRTAKPACFFYSEVYLDGTPESRELGYRSGLSILPKPGFVSAFKHGSFPPLPIPVQQHKK